MIKTRPSLKGNNRVEISPSTSPIPHLHTDVKDGRKNYQVRHQLIKTPGTNFSFRPYFTPYFLPSQPKMTVIMNSFCRRALATTRDVEHFLQRSLVGSFGNTVIFELMRDLSGTAISGRCYILKGHLLVSEFE